MGNKQSIQLLSDIQEQIKLVHLPLEQSIVEESNDTELPEETTEAETEAANEIQN